MLKNYLAALSACTFTGAFAVAALATMLGKVPTVTGIGLVCISLLLTALSAYAIGLFCSFCYESVLDEIGRAHV